MQPLNCFSRNFSIAPSRFVFQHGGETPTEAPKPPEGSKKETPPQKAGKDTVDAAKARLEKLQQNRFQELRDKVNELNGQLKERKGDMQKIGMDKDISFQLFDVVKELNKSLSLGIENTSVDIHSEGANLVIQYSGFEERHRGFRGKDKPFVNGDTGLDYKIIIRPDLTWEKQFTYEGKTQVEKHP